MNRAADQKYLLTLALGVPALVAILSQLRGSHPTPQASASPAPDPNPTITTPLSATSPPERINLNVSAKQFHDAANTNQVLTQARAVPYYRDGKPAGYKLISITPGSIYDRLGLKNGDVLFSMNGNSFDLNGFPDPKPGTTVHMEILRDSKPMLYTIDFK